MEPIHLTIIVCTIIIAVVVVAIAFKALEHRCRHEWEIQESLPVYGNNGNVPVAFLYVLGCKKCGDIRQHEVKHRSSFWEHFKET